MKLRVREMAIEEGVRRRSKAALHPFHTSQQCDKLFKLNNILFKILSTEEVRGHTS
jgi:hypothetical protein